MSESPTPLAAALAAALADAIVETIATADGRRCRPQAATPVGGGCISRNYRLDCDAGRYFVKTGRGAAALFAAESDGLAALARCDALRVPRVVGHGSSASSDDFLVLEWLDLDAGGDPARLGEALAALHGITLPRFGWTGDNFIGSTPQANAWHDDWPRFFADCRLAPQLELAARRGASRLAARGEGLLAALPGLLAGHQPAAALLHGDLWAGNQGFVGGRPALFDPAVYAGDGETDLAMSELFGGFPPRFYAAYHSVRRVDAGYRRRCRLYQLYHVLNHDALFGGYAAQAMAMIDELLAAGH